MTEKLPPHTSRLARFRIVLSNPDSSFNIGAVCRAMKTMGFRRLSIAGRILNFDPEKIRFMAVHAYDVFQNADRFDTLEEALAGTTLSAGVTRRHGKGRKLSFYLPEELAVATMTAENSGDVALVFGNEEHGLTTEELAACGAAVHIPSSPKFPSLNLSHAVQVVTYSFLRTAERLHYREGSDSSVDRARLSQTVNGIVDSLAGLGFFRISDSEPTRVFLRDVMSRAMLSSRELDEIERMFRKIHHIKR